MGCAWLDAEHTRCSECFEWDKKKKTFVKLERELAAERHALVVDLSESSIVGLVLRCSYCGGAALLRLCGRESESFVPSRCECFVALATKLGLQVRAEAPKTKKGAKQR